MRAVAIRAWLVAIVALALAGAGITSLAAGSTVTSLSRMAVAGGVLAAYTATVALLVTPRAERTLARCLWWGGLVPGVVAVVTTVLVTSQAGFAPGVVSGLPWLVGAVPVCALGRHLPALPSWRNLLRRRPPEHPVADRY